MSLCTPISKFNQLACNYNGIGVSILLTENYNDINVSSLLNGIPVQYIRVIIGIVDPGISFLNSSNSTTDSFWVSSIPYQTVLNDIATITPKVKLILSFHPPPTWTNSGSLVTNTQINSYARLIVSGFIYVSSLAPTLDILGVEPLNSPDSVNTHISTGNLINLVNYIKSIALTRSVSFSCIGPGVSSVSPIATVIDENYVYTQALAGQPNTFDIWNINGIENSSDLALVNTISGRSYMFLELMKDSTMFNFTSYGKELVLSSLSSIATIFPDYVTDYGTSSPSTVEYGIRLAEGFVSGLTNRFSTVIFDQLTNSNTALYNGSNQLQNYSQLLTLISTKFGTTGSIYTEETLQPFNANTSTLKIGLLQAGNLQFNLLLCRPVSDTFNGSLKCVINTYLWSNAYEVISCTFSYFPSSTSNSATLLSWTFESCCSGQGTGTFVFSGLPYNCVLFIQLNLGLVPAPVVVPTPPANYLETFFQVALTTNVPTGTIANGTVYYNSTLNEFLVFDSILGWITASTLF
jgi:hypothetical protein